jgi:hypothetical protein
MAKLVRIYGVPAKRGKRVEYDSRAATITSSDGCYLRLRFDGESRTHRAPFHPLYKIDYLDGVDYEARHHERVERFVQALRGPAGEGSESPR